MDFNLNRKKLFSLYKDNISDIPEDERLIDSEGNDYTIDDFLGIFEDSKRTTKLFKYLNKYFDIKDEDGNYATYEYFVKKYSCDKSWATSYCGSSGNANTGGDGSTSTDQTSERQKNINKIYCSLDSNKKVTLANSKTNGWTWDECKNTFDITQAEEDIAKNSCGGSSTTDGSGSTTKPAVSWTDTNATEQDVANGTLIKKLMKGDIVTKIQNHLIKHGFNNVSFSKKADGKFGSRTKKAVIDFQRSKGLKDDGIVGPKTWAELIKDKSSVATTTSGSSTTTTTTTQTGSTPAPDNKSDTSPIVVNTDTGI